MRQSPGYSTFSSIYPWRDSNVPSKTGDVVPAFPKTTCEQ